MSYKTKGADGGYTSTNFRGYLFGYVDNSNVIHPFPHKYMALETWSSTPNQREEIKAYRDDNTRDLTRVTAAGRKSIFSFETRDRLRLDEVKTIKTFFTAHESNTDERKIKLAFWNEERNQYIEGYFYRPNMAFPVKQIVNNALANGDVYVDIIYGKLKLEFIEY